MPAQCRIGTNVPPSPPPRTRTDLDGKRNHLRPRKLAFQKQRAGRPAGTPTTSPTPKRKPKMAEAPSAHALTALAVVMSLMDALVKRGVIDHTAVDATLKDAGTFAQVLC